MNIYKYETMNYFYRINENKEIETGILVPKQEAIREYIEKAFSEMPEKDKGLLYAKTNSKNCFLIKTGVTWDKLSVSDYFTFEDKVNFNNGINFHTIEYYPKTKYNMKLYESEVLKYCNGEYLSKYLLYVDNSNSSEYKNCKQCLAFIDSFYSKNDELFYLNKLIKIPEKIFWLDALLYGDRERFKWIDDEKMANELLNLFEFVQKFEPLKFDMEILDKLVKCGLFNARLINEIEYEFDDKILKHIKYKRKGNPIYEK